jgi:hypothetical protein
VRDGWEPLHQREPQVQIPAAIRIGDVEVDVLLLVGRGVAILHERQIRTHPVGEAKKVQVPVEPPTRVLLPEQDLEEGTKEQ